MGIHKNEIKKIIFSGQILRDNFSYTIEWFYGLLSYQLEAVTSLPTYALVAKNHLRIFDNYLLFDVEKFYDFYGHKKVNSLDKKAKDKLWSEIFYNEEFNKNAYEYVYSIFKDSLVIVHELEEVLVKILEHFGVPYIDINTDPIRFMDDQLFSFRSDNEKVYKELLKFRIPEEQIYLEANYSAVTYRSKANKEKANKIVLFLGQTDCDKSLINKETGELYSILNHKEDFKNAISGYDMVYYKRHPMVVDDSQVINYISSLSSVYITNDNFYDLMARNDIKKVVSISSGGCIEAKYYNKETQSLLRESISLNWGNDFDKDKYISIYNDFFSLHFWAVILKPILKTKDFDPNIRISGKNKLRNSRGPKCYWGYEDFDHEIIKSDATALLKEALSNTESKKQFFDKIKKTIRFCHC